MKILFFCRLFYPHIGGVEKHVLELSKELSKKGNEIVIVTEQISENDKTAEQLEIPESKTKIQIYRIPVGKDDYFKKLRIWKWFWQHRNLLQNADIIHIHDVFFWYLPFRFLSPLKRVYVTFHGYESYPIRKKAIMVRKIAEKLSWGNICIGDFITKWYMTKPTFVSYGAVDTGQNILKIQKVKNESAVFIGRLDEQTGILEYIKAVKTIKKKYPQFELLVVGDGKYRELVKGNSKIIGFRNNPEQYFATYHFAFASRYLSILEALSAKRLVFALFDNPVKEDYLRMAPFAPFIIIKKDPEKLAEKVEYFLGHPEKEKENIEKGYEWVKGETWRKMAQIYLQLWKENKLE